MLFKATRGSCLKAARLFLIWQDAMLDFCDQTLVPRFRSFSNFFLELMLSHMKGMRMPGQRITLHCSTAKSTAVVQALFDP